MADKNIFFYDKSGYGCTVALKTPVVMSLLLPASRATRALSNSIILLAIIPLNLKSDDQVTYACDSKGYPATTTEEEHVGCSDYGHFIVCKSIRPSCYHIPRRSGYI